MPASYRGVEFHVEAGGGGHGRRNVGHEFPKQDTPYTEDMGRRQRRFPVTAYIVDQDYIPLRDMLIDACEQEGPGMLILPTTRPILVNCDGCSWIESRERGGFVAFELLFLEAGAAPSNATPDTQGAVQAAAGTPATETAPIPPSRPTDLGLTEAPIPPSRPADLGVGAGPASANAADATFRSGFASPAART